MRENFYELRVLVIENDANHLRKINSYLKVYDFIPWSWQPDLKFLEELNKRSYTLIIISIDSLNMMLIKLQ